MLVCAFYHFIAHETAGAARIRLSLRPLTRGRDVEKQNSGDSRREIAEVYPQFKNAFPHPSSLRPVRNCALGRDDVERTARET
jgi:hypothetical protein